jgi:hypothetical protein
VGMAPKNGSSLDAYSPVAKRRTFRADGDNPYMLWHVVTFLARLYAPNALRFSGGPAEAATRSDKHNRPRPRVHILGLGALKVTHPLL